MSGAEASSGIEELARFGGQVSEPIDRRLREAARVYADTTGAESLLREAQALDPQCLPVYFALYKFYFYKRRLADAESAALLGLAAAAAQGGFPADWNTLSAKSARWATFEGPQHFYLFSLKALAFIRLRLDRAGEARELLEKLAELDPQDSVGASVIRSLAGATAHARSDS